MSGPNPTPSSAPDVMRAVIQTDYGSADVLKTATVEVPSPGGDEVLVEVHAAGVDRGVWHGMTGLPYLGRVAFGIRVPRRPVPGFDVAGIVVGVGEGVTRFQPGDEVFGVGKGTFAEYAVAKEVKLVHKPATLTFTQAAAIPISGMTAIEGLVDVGKIAAGQHVMVVGASGGVGTFAVQIANAFGARVTGVASTAKLDLVRSLGVDRVIDYTHRDFTAGGDRYDLIFDTGGSTPLRRLRRVLAPTGTLVIVGGEGAGDILGIGRQLRAVAWSPFIRQRLKMFISKEHHSFLERLRELVDQGNLHPVIDRVYRLDDTPAAMRHLEAGQIRGKAVIGIRTES